MQVWNWGVIAGFTGALTTLLAGIIALYISSKWRYEKNSEVLSNEAAKILTTIQDFKEKLAQIQSLMMDIEYNGSYKTDVEELKEVARKLRDRSLLFSELITNKKDLVLEITVISYKFYYETRDLGELTTKDIITSPNIRTLVERFVSEIENPRDIIKTYFLYGKIK